MAPVPDAPRPHLYAAGLWALVPAMAFFSLAGLLLFGDGTDVDLPLGPLSPVLWMAFALLYPLVVGGGASLLGLALAGVGTYRSARFPTVVAGGVAVVLGQAAIRGPASELGEVLVFLGTGFAALPARPRALLPATLAIVGVLVRDRSEWGRLVIAAAAGALAVLLVLAGRDQLPRPDSRAAT